MTDALPWLLLGTLLVLSGFFSAAETALFSLSLEDRERAGPRVHRLLDEPRELLVSVLLGNLLVNLLFFAFAARFLPGEDAKSGIVSGFAALFAILLVGEILPKTIALRAALPVARLSSLPLSSLVFALSPARRFVNMLLDAFLRALGQVDSGEPGVTPEALAEVLERSADEGVLAPGEADLLAEIIELGALRVREIMTPRVDMLAIDLRADVAAQEAVVREAARRRMPWLPVIRETSDDVVGCIEVRDYLVQKDKNLERIVMPVKFVPEVAPVLSLLRVMREDRISEAVVVDEWGGTAGVVTVEDIFEELVGDLRVEGEMPEQPVEFLGKGRFRVSGGLSVRDWNDEFGMRVVPTEFETVGGFVTALLGRIPVPGDRVTLGGGIAGEVREVRGRRVHTVDLYIDDAARAEAAAP